MTDHARALARLWCHRFIIQHGASGQPELLKSITHALHPSDEKTEQLERWSVAEVHRGGQRRACRSLRAMSTIVRLVSREDRDANGSSSVYGHAFQ